MGIFSRKPNSAGQPRTSGSVRAGILQCSVIVGQTWGVVFYTGSLDDWKALDHRVTIIGGFPSQLMSGRGVDLQQMMGSLVAECERAIPGINVQVAPGAGFEWTDPDIVGSFHLALDVTYDAGAYDAWLKTLPG
jgi:hypothetical protein